MSIINQAAKQIQDMVPVHDLSDLIHGDLYGKFFGVDQKRVSFEEAAWVINSLECTPEDVFEAEHDVLGTYQAMTSPGRITLYWQRIGGFFWHTLLDVSHHHRHIELEEITRLIELTVHKTYSHEKFHHACDVGRHLFGVGQDHLIEEALAVAWSYQHLEKLLKLKRYAVVNRPLVGEFLELIYQYSAPGYRDWISYRDQRSFYRGVSEYLLPAPALKTLSVGRVDVTGIMRGFVSDTVKGQAALEEIQP